LSPPNVRALGIVGLGQAGALVIDAIRATPNLPWRLVAGADPREHAQQQFASEFGEGYPDAETLCRDSSVDAVYIASPSWMHLEHVRIAARYGKHIICEKPLTLSIDDCVAMLDAAQAAGVMLLAGHTHSFDAPIRKMAELIQSGELGSLRSVNCWNFNEFNHRPRLLSELVSTHGPVLNQGPHHVDIVRQIAGTPVRSVRANTIPDGVTGVEGGYTAFLEFDNRVPATLVYDGRALFDTAELFEWVGEGGSPRDPGTNAGRRADFETLMRAPEAQRDASLAQGKERGRYGGASAGQLPNAHVPGQQMHQPFFGLVVAACEEATLRQSADGLYLYDRSGRREVAVERASGGRVAELIELHDALINNRRPFHDGAWGLATLEVCFAILKSAKNSKEIILKHQ
jgi:predicted dehydrogenase